MANEIQAKFGTATALTITLASLASSTAGVGKQSTIVTANIFQLLHIYAKIRVGASPTINTNIHLYFLGGDGTVRADGAGASDAGITIVNASRLGVIRVNSATGNLDYYGVFTVRNPGTEWGIALVQDTGETLNATEAESVIRYQGENPEVQ